MNEPTYTVKFDTDNDYYIFESIGQNGSIFKVVVFSKIKNNIYNLGFGDYDLQTKAINDKSVSDNGDMINQYEIYGYKNDVIPETFQKNTLYESFLIRKLF